MFIVTLPNIQDEDKIVHILEHPSVGGVRYNVGAVSPFTPKETLEKLKLWTERAGKKFWIDLKGRQLRIKHWAAPEYGKIQLNHSLEVDAPAKVVFRGNDVCEVRFVRGDTIFVTPRPRHAVGRGQALNVIGHNLKIHGYLTEEDKEYIAAATELGMVNYMLSFVESFEDVTVVMDEMKAAGLSNDNLIVAEFVLKIENPKGLEFVRTQPREFFNSQISLMAARDDLMVNLDDKGNEILEASQDIVLKDPKAICASRIFQGLEKDGQVAVGDWADLFLMKQFGYENFMLSDGISYFHFDEAVEAWEKSFLREEIQDGEFPEAH